MSFLEKIVSAKKAEIKILKKKTKELEESAKKDIPGNFLESISKDKVNVIAEVKQASPSLGVIKKNFDPIKTAEIYSKNGANAISVLTEKDYFMGSTDFLMEISKKVDTPLLRKDFIIDELQVLETAGIGANALLLIAAILPLRKLRTLIKKTREWGLDFILEVHDEDDLKKALKTDAEIIGINNRNLKTLEIDLSNALKISNKIPKDRKIIVESGIQSMKDLHLYTELGLNTFLIGRYLMEHGNPAELLHSIKTSRG